MEKDKYIQDLADIKNMMENSSRFLSLSGLSGVLAGTLALIAAYLANEVLYSGQNYFQRDFVYHVPFSVIVKLGIIALLTVTISIGLGIYLTYRKTKKQGLPFFDVTAKNLLKSLAIPLITGGLVSLILVKAGLIALVAPSMLIFYGLALVNASKYTLHLIQYLGYTEIILGLIAGLYIGYGLFFWAIGFGLCHIIYGAYMYFKFERN